MTGDIYFCNYMVRHEFPRAQKSKKGNLYLKQSFAWWFLCNLFVIILIWIRSTATWRMGRWCWFRIQGNDSNTLPCTSTWYSGEVNHPPFSLSLSLSRVYIYTYNIIYADAKDYDYRYWGVGHHPWTRLWLLTLMILGTLQKCSSSFKPPMGNSYLFLC